MIDSYWNYIQTSKGIESGNRFQDAFDDALKNARHLDIVSGYVGKQQCNDYSKKLFNISALGGRVRVLVGMAFRESLSKNTFKPWKDLDVALRGTKTNSGIYSFRMPIHSKVYLTYDQNLKPLKTFVGSSNFNFTTPYMECTVEIPNSSNINNFVNGLFNNRLLIDFEDVPLKGTKKDPQSDSSHAVPALQKANIKFDPLKLTLLESINLRDICRKNPIASLNLYHSAGRKSGNKWVPRTWYEVELTLGNKNFPNLPRDFTAITDNGYEIEMQRRSGAKKGNSHLGMKDLTSKDNRRIFGRWIKGKLEDAGVLHKGDIINDDTFNQYGNDTLKFYRIEDSKIFMEF